MLDGAVSNGMEDPQIRSAIAVARKRTLDIIECTMGDDVLWPQIRTRLLGIFGRSGLEGALLRNGQSSDCKIGKDHHGYLSGSED